MTFDVKSNRRWYQGLSVVRWIFVIIGILIMTFTGGCSLIVLGNRGLQVAISDFAGVVIFAGYPFLIGLIIWWLAAKIGRSRQV